MKSATLLLLVTATAANAGVTYRYRHTTVSPLMRTESAGRVWIEGARQRIELDPEPGQPRAYDVSISEDGGKTSLLINVQNRTWFHTDDLPSVARSLGSSELFHLPGFRVKERIDQIRVNPLPAEDGGDVSGHSTRKHILSVSYRLRGELEGERLTASVALTVWAWVAGDVPPLHSARSVKTGFTDLDPQIEQWFDALGGGIVKQDVAVTRTMAGGRPLTGMSHFIGEDIREVTIPSSRFERPSGLKHQLPIFGFGSPMTTPR